MLVKWGISASSRGVCPRVTDGAFASFGAPHDGVWALESGLFEIDRTALQKLDRGTNTSEGCDEKLP